MVLSENSKSADNAQAWKARPSGSLFSGENNICDHDEETLRGLSPDRRRKAVRHRPSVGFLIRDVVFLSRRVLVNNLGGELLISFPESLRRLLDGAAPSVLPPSDRILAPKYFCDSQPRRTPGRRAVEQLRL